MMITILGEDDHDHRLKSHQISQPMKILLRLGILKRIPRPNRMCAHQPRQKRHIVTIPRSRPIGTIINPIHPLYQPQRQHGHDIPPRIKRMSPGMIGRPPHQLGIDFLPLPQGMRNEHDGFLLQGQIVHPKPRGLHAKIVLVLDVDAPISFSRHLHVIGSAFQTLLPVLLVDDRPIRMHDGVHVSRVGMMIVRVDEGGENGVGEPSGGFVHVADGVGGTGEDDAIDVDVSVVFVVDSFFSVG
mmetsp:Transcript_14469/g.29648  ORF Transcript_14469/g.29648 Transcript_14469/m.29648 type:complete len:242 (-) Transcript_14469:976-1701(-)